MIKCSPADTDCHIFLSSMRKGLWARGPATGLQTVNKTNAIVNLAFCLTWENLKRELFRRGSAAAIWSQRFCGMCFLPTVAWQCDMWHVTCLRMVNTDGIQKWLVSKTFFHVCQKVVWLLCSTCFFCCIIIIISPGSTGNKKKLLHY